MPQHEKNCVLLFPYRPLYVEDEPGVARCNSLFVLLRPEVALSSRSRRGITPTQ